MKELLIAAVLLVFVLVRIKNIRKCWAFGYYDFPPVKTDKLYTWVYPGYIGGNAKDRRRILRKYPLPVGVRVNPEREKHTPPVKAQAKPLRAKPYQTPAWPLRQKMKRAGAYLPSKSELQGLFRRAA